MNRKEVIVFRVQEEEFAIPLGDIRDTVDCFQLSKVSSDLDYLEGIMDIDGKTIPVIRFSAKLGLIGDKPESRKVMIIELDSQEVGILVDEVEGVFPLRIECIQPDYRGNGWLGDCIEGLGIIRDHPIISLNTAQLFSTDELTEFRSIGELS